MSNLPKDVGPRTLAVHAGEAPDEITGASSPSIVMSTTFKTRDAEAFSIKDFDEHDMPYIYTRWGNPTFSPCGADGSGWRIQFAASRQAT